METWNHNVFVTWFPVSCCALNKWQMLLSPQGQQRTHWIINHKPFWVRREKQLNLFATSCINLQPSCWSVVQSIMSSRGWWVCSCIELWVELLWPCLFLDTFFFPTGLTLEGVGASCSCLKRFYLCTTSVSAKCASEVMKQFQVWPLHEWTRRLYYRACSWPPRQATPHPIKMPGRPCVEELWVWPGAACGEMR